MCEDVERVYGVSRHLSRCWRRGRRCRGPAAISAPTAARAGRSRPAGTARSVATCQRRGWGRWQSSNYSSNLHQPPDLKSPWRFFTNPSWLFTEPDKKLKRLTSRNKIWWSKARLKIEELHSNQSFKRRLSEGCSWRMHYNGEGYTLI